MASRCWTTVFVLLRRCLSAQHVCGPRMTLLPQKTSVRGSFLDHYIPPSQYSERPHPKFQFPGVLSTYYELVPVFVCTGLAVAGVVFNAIWACFHKVDVVFTTHNLKNISRTMDLLNPTCHKLITINQVYKPWPEMARVLRKMKEAQCARAQKNRRD